MTFEILRLRNYTLNFNCVIKVFLIMFSSCDKTFYTLKKLGTEKGRVSGSNLSEKNLQYCN